MIELVIEEIDKNIPLELKQSLMTKNYRELLLEKYGPSAFLDPYNLSYPIYEMETGLNGKLVYASYLRAKQNNNEIIANKAKEIFNNSNFEDLNIHLNENEQMDLIDFTSLFTIKENEFLFDFIE